MENVGDSPSRGRRVSIPPARADGWEVHYDLQKGHRTFGGGRIGEDRARKQTIGLEAQAATLKPPSRPLCLGVCSRRTAMPAHIHPAIEPDDPNLSLRRHPRTLFSVPITLRHLCRGGVRATRGISLDLGEGGLGAIVQGGVHVGDTVAIDLRLSEQLLTTVAIVRHTSSVRSGFEFVGLTPAERLQIMSLIGQS